MPEWLRGAGAFISAASEMSEFASHGGQLYPPAFPWYILGTAGQAAAGTGPGRGVSVPTTTDVLVTHSPVKGLPDLASPTYMGVQFGPVWREKNSDGTIRADNRFSGDGVGIQFGTVPRSASRYRARTPSPTCRPCWPGST